jgi:hypothetical protein
MEISRDLKDFVIVLFVSFVLALCFSYPTQVNSLLEISKFFIYFIIILLVNLIAKKFFAFNLETDVNLNIWSINHYGLTKRDHFNKPLPMIWLPIITSLISVGRFVWMPLIEFDVAPRPERVSRRHGLYRFTEVTEWHIALIATAGIFANLIIAVIAYFAGFEQFTKLSVAFAFWQLIPFSRLDGSKIFFGSKNLWLFLILVVGATLIWGLSIN